METNGHLTDSYGRRIRDLRISVTDRCNFRCFYCLPNGEPPLARKDTILTFEEIALASEIFVSLGIEKIRLTGGEPMLRKGIDVLVGALSNLKKRAPSDGALKDLALTTNGFRIPENSINLKHLGLDRLTISLDSLDKANFQAITGVDKLEDVLAAIRAAKEAGLNPVKINAVIVRGRNDHEIADLAAFAIQHDLSMRFIEFMPLDSGHDWNREMVVSGKEIFSAINAVYPIELKRDSRGFETAWNYRFKESDRGEIGIIAPVTEMFCGACSRIRLTADGQIRTCLFSTGEHDLRSVLRTGATNSVIADFIRNVTLTKEPSHKINQDEFVQPTRSMSFIGG